MKLLGEIRWCETHGCHEAVCVLARLRRRARGRHDWPYAAGVGECHVIEGVAFALPEPVEADPEYMAALEEMGRGVREPAAWTRGR